MTTISAFDPESSVKEGRAGADIIFRNIDHNLWYVEHCHPFADCGYPLGTAYVSVDSGSPPHSKIRHVEVNDGFRRRGNATRLVDACHERWPNIRLSDATTEAGEAFLDSIPHYVTRGEMSNAANSPALALGSNMLTVEGPVPSERECDGTVELIFRKIYNNRWYVELWDSQKAYGYPLGSAIVTRHPEPPPMLYYIEVRERFRRQGVATRLVQACERRWPNISLSEPVTHAGEAFLASIPDHES